MRRSCRHFLSFPRCISNPRLEMRSRNQRMPSASVSNELTERNASVVGISRRTSARMLLIRRSASAALRRLLKLSATGPQAREAPQRDGGAELARLEVAVAAGLRGAGGRSNQQA